MAAAVICRNSHFSYILEETGYPTKKAYREDNDESI